jgi:hypothetical protein
VLQRRVGFGAVRVEAVDAAATRDAVATEGIIAEEHRECGDGVAELMRGGATGGGGGGHGLGNIEASGPRGGERSGEQGFPCQGGN